MKNSQKQILLIEDDSDIRESIQLLLEMEGFTVRTARNGKEGLEYLAKIAHPCLILLDLFMPVMNGYQFLDALEKNGDLIASLPIIVLTAAANHGNALTEVKKKSKGILRKPIDLEGFLKVVKQYCCEGEAEAQPT